MKLSKVNKTTDSKDIFSSTVEKVTMGIDMANLSHITKLLTELYEFPIEATVREVISNAIDTTKRLDESDRLPIEVSLPNELNPEFIVTDFGEGMSRDVLESVYSQYGTSTKSDDFSQIGAFGLGAKAPLSYCSKFVVSSTKDNWTTEAFLTSTSEGNYCEILESKETGKPNGTTVSIPVMEDDFNKFLIASESYREYNLGVEVDFLGMDNHNRELLSIGSIPVMEDEDGNPVNLDLYYIGNESDFISSILLKGGSGIIDFSLSGWTYSDPANKYEKPSYLIDLKPGVFNFSSSRDNITIDSRYHSVMDKIKEEIDIINSKYIEDLVKVGDFDKHTLLEIITNDNLSAYNVSKSIERLREMGITFNGMNVDEYIEEEDIFNFDLIMRRDYRYKSGTTSSIIEMEDNIGNKKLTFFENGLTAVKDNLDWGLSPLQTMNLIKQKAYTYSQQIILITDINKDNDNKDLRKVIGRSSRLGKEKSSELYFLGTTGKKEKVMEYFKCENRQSMRSRIDYYTIDEYIELTDKLLTPRVKRDEEDFNFFANVESNTDRESFGWYFSPFKDMYQYSDPSTVFKENHNIIIVSERATEASNTERNNIIKLMTQYREKYGDDFNIIYTTLSRITNKNVDVIVENTEAIVLVDFHESSIRDNIYNKISKLIKPINYLDDEFTIKSNDENYLRYKHKYFFDREFNLLKELNNKELNDLIKPLTEISKLDMNDNYKIYKEVAVDDNKLSDMIELIENYLDTHPIVNSYELRSDEVFREYIYKKASEDIINLIK